MKKIYGITSVDVQTLKTTNSSSCLRVVEAAACFVLWMAFTSTKLDEMDKLEQLQGGLRQTKSKALVASLDQLTESAMTL